MIYVMRLMIYVKKPAERLFSELIRLLAPI